MVDIREESNQTPDGSDGTSGGAGDAQPQQHQHQSGSRLQDTIAFIKSRPLDAVLWGLRMMTVFLALGYTFSIGGPQQQASFYSKTLLAGAATNCLRLHQRMGGFRFSREFFSQMFLEDSCHYLFYCVLFVGNYPITMVLLPVLLFALLHASSFTLQLMNVCGMNGTMLHRGVTTFTEQYAQNLLNVIACTEIFLMPMVVILIFMGRSSILVPFIYYRFLTLRYMSRRNPNTRIAFHQLRVSIEQTVNRPGCPPFLRNGVDKLISLIERFSPQQQAA